MKTLKRVSFEDCDPFAHLNNANYLTYFLNAREEQLRTNRILDILEHAKETGKSWAVISHNIKYLKPARMGEKLEIWSRMLTFNAFIDLIEFVMIEPVKHQLKSVMHSQLAYFSIKEAKPVKHDRQITQLFSQIALFPDEKINTFQIDNRIKHIKLQLKKQNKPIGTK